MRSSFEGYIGGCHRGFKKRFFIKGEESTVCRRVLFFNAANLTRFPPENGLFAG